MLICMEKQGKLEGNFLDKGVNLNTRGGDLKMKV